VLLVAWRGYCMCMLLTNYMYALLQVSAWFDEGILRQREAKAAVLAIRRHLRYDQMPAFRRYVNSVQCQQMKGIIG
jgi:hypothetical protein